MRGPCGPLRIDVREPGSLWRWATWSGRKTEKEMHRHEETDGETARARDCVRDDAAICVLGPGMPALSS